MNHQKMSLLTDFYELTMMNGFLKHDMSEKTAVFDLFFREGRESTYCIACGLEQAVQYVLNLKFFDDEIEYLRTLNCFDESFLEKLKDFKFNGDIRAMKEGTVVFPYEPLLIVKGTIFEAQLLESALLNIVNFQTLIATKSARVNRMAEGKTVLEFGLRRAQAPDAAVYGARAAIIGGCDNTSNVLASRMFGTAPRGTHAHSWVMAFPSEIDAFRAYANMYPENCTLLIDTYDTLSGLKNALIVFGELRTKGFEPKGIRLDSGDLAYLTKKARKILNEEGYPNVSIVVSGDLDEYTIQSLKNQGAQIDAYGVGTRLITSHNNPSLGGVYKVAMFDGQPKMKISNNLAKMTNPGEKTIFRLFDKDSKKAIADLITIKGESVDEDKQLTLVHPTERWKKVTVENFVAKELYTDIVKAGKLVYTFPAISDIKQYCQDSLNGFWDEYKRIDRPQLYKVDLSDELYELKMKLIEKGGN